MLHHANVDRLWAMWEELYPQEKVLNPAYDSQGTFAISPGTKIDGESPLLPFFGPGKSDFTSANVIDCETFGYTYPELSSSGSSEDRRRQMASIVNRMYGPDSDDGGRDVVTPSIPGPTAPASTGGRLPGSAVPTGSASMPESIISLSSAAPESTNDVSSDLGRLPGTDLPADDSISVPASVPTSGASATETADGVTGGVSGGLTGIPSATLTAQPTGTGTPDDDFQLFPELPDINTTIPDISNPFPEDLIPDLPDLGIDIGDGLEYVCKIKIAAGNLPTPSEMNVYVGGKQAGSFAVLSTPHDGYVAGEFSLRKVLGVLGLLKGLISDLVSGKIRNPVDVIKDNIHVEFIHVSFPAFLFMKEQEQKRNGANKACSPTARSSPTSLSRPTTSSSSRISTSALASAPTSFPPSASRVRPRLRPSPLPSALASACPSAPRPATSPASRSSKVLLTHSWERFYWGTKGT